MVGVKFLWTGTLQPSPSSTRGWCLSSPPWPPQSSLETQFHLRGQHPPTGVSPKGISAGLPGPYVTIGKLFSLRQWQPTPVLLPGKSHGQRSLEGCTPGGRKESDTTERLHFHFSLSCTGKGNGNPLQCSCLENPRDGGAWWAAVCGVAQSRTQLKRLNSSSSSASVYYQ